MTITSAGPTSLSGVGCVAASGSVLAVALTLVAFAAGSVDATAVAGTEASPTLIAQIAAAMIAFALPGGVTSVVDGAGQVADV